MKRNRTQQLKAWLIGGICFLVIPNILFWLLDTRMYLIRGIFVAEYFFIALLYPYISRRVFNILWLTFALFDLIFASTSLFFMDFAQMLEALSGLTHISSWQVVKLVFLASIFVFISWLLLILLKKIDGRIHFLKPKIILTYLLLVILIDYVGGANTLNVKSDQATLRINQNVISVPIFSVGLHIVWSFRKEKEWGVTPARSVAKEVFGVDNSSDTAERIQLLVLVESWGSLKNEQLQRNITRPLHEMAAKKEYILREGLTPYRFLTQIAEMREITGYLRTFPSQDTAFIRKNSLFIEKQRQGYQVVGLHGYASGFYNREKCWPALGVQQMFFAKEFSSYGLRFGGNPFFRGATDTAIANWLMNQIALQKERKMFYYWVTLNTHLPLSNRNDAGFRSYVHQWKESGIDSEVLQLSYQLTEFFTVLAEAINRSGTRMHVLLVGDHAPPFVDRAQREVYDPQFVPFMELKPK